MVGLHRGNYVLTTKARYVAGTQVLGMFDAKSAVTWAVGRGSLFEEIQDVAVGLVANGVNENLQTGLVGGDDALQHGAFGQHLVEKQAARVRSVRIGLEKKRGGRPQ